MRRGRTIRIENPRGKRWTNARLAHRLVDRGQARWTAHNRIRLTPAAARAHLAQQIQELREEELADIETRLYRGEVLFWKWMPRWSGRFIVYQAVPKLEPPEESNG
jgi:hypothetical protein